MQGITESCILVLSNQQKNKMKVFATLSNGNQTQINVIGNTSKIVSFIENYNGNDLGNDLICQNFVTDFEETGVIIEA